MPCVPGRKANQGRQTRKVSATSETPPSFPARWQARRLLSRSVGGQGSSNRSICSIRSAENYGCFLRKAAPVKNWQTGLPPITGCHRSRQPPTLISILLNFETWADPHALGGQ